MTHDTASVGELIGLAAALRRGDVDLLAYVDEICARVETRDADLCSFVPEEGRRERLRREARALLARWPDPHQRPPLFGVPVGVKDVLHAEGLPTRAGSALPPESLAGQEATAVSRLRAAGALIAGKTVTAEFAFYAPGPTRNPHHRDHSPGGSSSGSAAAVAAGLVPLALGTQTVGSVIRPAAYCGVVGFKPTYGRVPTDGVIANAPSFDTVGLFARDVASAAAAAAVLCTGWRATTPRGEPTFAVPEGPYLEQASPPARQAFAEQVERLRTAGVRVRFVPALADIEEINRRHHLINLVELARSHEFRFPVYGDRYHPITARAIEDGRRISRAAYERALDERERYAADLVALMDAESIDAWLTPAATDTAPQGLDTTGSPVMNLPWSQARMPAVGLPAGRGVNGLPLGLQCVARPGADEELLHWAGQLAEALGSGTPADQRST
ncbi:amidase [Thermasporomyces composti]|jgi:Asp-tRNA(Asn)/Glu-tRNA(Gln) amidotransferase A subunit family amidase|uniref:Asp-tRNA(Asn)/Glu-tRNA(Gln) amidotransferase A subunit family amidase n=1 Tax=Thermasporomyces composti TaxID=696763 RepID=A0A3D9V4S2_THECX|nr:amidase [Thermasporomyces composti]REF36517.1 Asp-tRNA(Asn)/Glu-tRNA(Gln) amidotransferase A subunit family amidase [Thermasporomyces composti]